MAELFDRKVRLTIGREPPTNDYVTVVPDALVLTDLRVQFRVEKALRTEPQKASVTVYNLAAVSRGQLVGKGLRVVLEAGYADGMGIIYSGHTRDAEHPKRGVDWVSHFGCGTNEREIGFANMSESFKPGALVKDVIKKAVTALVKDPGNALEKIAALPQSFASGYAVHGPAAEELTTLLSPHGLTWSIQDGRMEILGANDVLAEAPVDLNGNTGLIGTPEMGSPSAKGGPSVLKVRSLLQARFAPGRKILLNSRARSGIFKAVKVTHIGDTHGGEWVTEVEAVPVPT